ncbi:MAG: enoyl-CoA hydratase/isomerase family protein [Microthrixaceae bacterium]
MSETEAPDRISAAVVQTDIDDSGIAIVTMNRPERLNSMSMELIGVLHDTVDRLDRDPSVRVVILTGAGRAFCAGLDIKGGDDPGDPGAPIEAGMIPASLQIQEFIASLHERIHRSRKPFIAAVNGVAVGGGFSLALACDVRIASSAASFGAVFIRLGISACDMGTSYFLPRLVGASRSAELLLTGRIFDAAEAERIGLLSTLVEPADLMPRAIEIAKAIASNGPLAVWMTKETMWQTVDAPSLRAALDIENRTQVMCAATGVFAASRIELTTDGPSETEK